jgi:hypothetical protein
MDMTNCPHCSEEITDDSDFCPHCGVLFEEAGDVMCDVHTKTPALGVCIICRKVLCRECCVAANGRIFCGDHGKVTVQQDWAEVFRSTDITEAELVKSILDTAGCTVQTQNFNSIGFVWDGGGDSPISRSNINKPAQVFVPIPEYLNSLQLVKEWKSSQQEINEDETESENS